MNSPDNAMRKRRLVLGLMFGMIAVAGWLMFGMPNSFVARGIALAIVLAALKVGRSPAAHPGRAPGPPTEPAAPPTPLRRSRLFWILLAVALSVILATAVLLWQLVSDWERGANPHWLVNLTIALFMVAVLAWSLLTTLLTRRL